MNYVIIQEYHYNVRLHLLKFMRAHENLLRRTRPAECSVDTYLTDTQMDEAGVWGTEVEIFAMATMTNTPVYVYSRYGERHQWLCYPPVLPEGSSVAVNSSDDDGLHSGEAIYITNVGQHFEPVTRIPN